MFIRILRAHCFPEFLFVLHLSASLGGLGSIQAVWSSSFSEPRGSSEDCSLYSSWHLLPYPAEVYPVCAQISVQRPSPDPMHFWSSFSVACAPPRLVLCSRFQLLNLPWLQTLWLWLIQRSVGSLPCTPVRKTPPGRKPGQTFSGITVLQGSMSKSSPVYFCPVFRYLYQEGKSSPSYTLLAGSSSAIHINFSIFPHSLCETFLFLSCFFRHSFKTIWNLIFFF